MKLFIDATPDPGGTQCARAMALAQWLAGLRSHRRPSRKPDAHIDDAERSSW
ncbi:hypothetical protein OK349_00275 [Sphingomonas sp. BT-65]|uniref:hypothetical protein n=1 Tax=Sphingomonas sp. BT-65 TaxID=2989821 RepID=UPI002235D400|nr:hypothetical protein [Sphingomonas sp. BT-65]MCW4460129.1 hypothetical protein [Sphingomonas sp. BT-65]